MKSYVDFSTDIDLNDYNYPLSESKIAKYPLKNRDASKLLFFDQGNIKHYRFRDIVSILPDNSHLYFNNTKVIPARLYFQKKTGAIIELFLLNPELPEDLNQTMASGSPVYWRCMIGNQRKWKDGQVLESVGTDKFKVTAHLANRNQGTVKIEWDSDITFSELIQELGKTPLPPYINRKPEPEDSNRYQTVYAANQGAVAAPTAGLHFTDNILKEIKRSVKGVHDLTLHVSAGTFQPISVDQVEKHPMHCEQVSINKSTIASLLSEGIIVPVGTTSMRTLESLYWFGVKLINGYDGPFFIEKLFPYQTPKKRIPPKKSIEEVITWMEHKKISILTGETEIFIFPGYEFKVCDALLTNFHLPKSTLILLVGAFVGEAWKEIYSQALNSGYRFLSYGDTSLLIPGRGNFLV